ncbi:MAG: phosphatidate cytidylyltransferase [Clostridia bacterium]|nr:phosphatidate cytidylyltransferase [Clostridia bacterium]
MKTRIISGIVMALITIGFILAGVIVNPLFISSFLIIISTIATYEIVKNAAGIKSKATVCFSMVFTALFVFLMTGIHRLAVLIPMLKTIASHRAMITLSLCGIYFFLCVVLIIKDHKDYDLGKIATLTTFVPVLSFAFCILSGIINAKYGVYYIILMIAFSNGCDMGAYFTGVSIGKHKLCPEISPKKTVEGAIGGIVTSIILTAVIMFVFRNHIEITAAKTVATILLTIPLCIVGMLGDLFASVIKRSVGIKDYGNLIPGHGGILDRFDSILLISPALFILIRAGII